MAEQTRKEIERANQRFGDGIRKGDAIAVGILTTILVAIAAACLSKEEKRRYALATDDLQNGRGSA